MAYRNGRLMKVTGADVVSIVCGALLLWPRGSGAERKDFQRAGRAPELVNAAWSRQVLRRHRWREAASLRRGAGRHLAEVPRRREPVLGPYRRNAVRHRVAELDQGQVQGDWRSVRD